MGTLSPMQKTFLEKIKNRVNCEKMDNLMPHMIGYVVPMITQPMIDYLQGKSNGI